MSDEGSGGETAVETKPCSKCKASKPLGAFRFDPRMRSGRRSCCRECDSRRGAARYKFDPGFRAAKLAWSLAYRADELGGLVSERGSCRAQLRGAVKIGTKDRLRQRIAALGEQIAALRAGREREREVA